MFFFFQFNYLTSTESSSPLFRKENIDLLENNGLRIKDCTVTVASMFTPVHSIHNPHLLPIIYMMRTSKFLSYANWLDLAPESLIFKHCNSVFFKTVYYIFLHIGCICGKANILPLISNIALVSEDSHEILTSSSAHYLTKI